MRQDPAPQSGNVRVYARPGRWATLAPLIGMLVTGLILVLIVVLLMRQS
jgi:hypothetical protein